MAEWGHTAKEVDPAPPLDCPWVRDVTFDEDRSQAGSGAIPQIMAAVRNPVISLLLLAGFASLAAATRRLAALPRDALALLGCSDSVADQTLLDTPGK